jgi:hypothetical protein
MRSFVVFTYHQQSNNCVAGATMRNIVVAYAAGETFFNVQIVFEIFIIYGIRR